MVKVLAFYKELISSRIIFPLNIMCMQKFMSLMASRFFEILIIEFVTLGFS